MIYCLSGELLELDAPNMTAVIDCGGVGFLLTVTGSAVTALSGSGIGSSVRVYTYMAVREDAMELYGFSSPDELRLFKLLISVSGVGPKAAVSMLSVMNPDSLISAIASEDAKSISRAPGVGAKTAARVVLELRDKVAKTFGATTAGKSAAASASVSRTVAGGGSLSDAVDALIVLGYSRSEAVSALSGLDASEGTEELIRLALAKLMK